MPLNLHENSWLLNSNLQTGLQPIARKRREAHATAVDRHEGLFAFAAIVGHLIL